MASIKDIRQRMANVRTTKQVLNAMDMVSATKLHKARSRLDGILAMHGDMKNTIDDLKRFDEIRNHPFAENRQVKQSAYVVITSDMGLCGSYNVNICNAALKHMSDGKNEKILSTGAKGCQYFRRREKNVFCRITDASEAQIYTGAGSLGEITSQMFASGDVDEVFLAYTEFESTLSHIPRVERLLPLYGDLSRLDELKKGEKQVGMKYEPDAASFLDHMLPLYLHMCFFVALSHSMACEHAARMMNMESAGKNAGEIIDDLNLMYNRKRQAAITQELNEIVSSANILQ
ncbi:MAG: ATP synthase F1 subunit gamma [Christensenellales bacterium]|jgi:F-type H+-transporting ATPase subunit gamma